MQRHPDFEQLELFSSGLEPEPKTLSPEAILLRAVGRGSSKMGAILETKSVLALRGTPTTFEALREVWDRAVQRRLLVPDGKTWRCA